MNQGDPSIIQIIYNHHQPTTVTPQSPGAAGTVSSLTVWTLICQRCVVAIGHCDTSTPLWIRGGHPTVEDGVVSRDVCGHWNGYCCYFGSYPIKVKACPGNYYVYELIRPAVFCTGYCAGDYFDYMCCFHISMMYVFLFINHYSSKLSDIGRIKHQLYTHHISSHLNW